jgi:hypothetical protein
MNQIDRKLKDAGVAAKFGSSFAEQYLAPAFGSRSKSEIDLLVFGCLIEAGAIDPRAPVYETARALNITPARVRGLLSTGSFGRRRRRPTFGPSSSPPCRRRVLPRTER